MLRKIGVKVLKINIRKAINGKFNSHNACVKIWSKMLLQDDSVLTDFNH